MTPPQTLAVPKKLMTADEFWDFVHLPENANKSFELRKGKVVEMSRPTRRHGSVTASITRILGNYTFEIGRGYIVSNDSGVILRRHPDIVVGPDVAYFTDANTLDEVHPKWGEEVPVLAVEVLSPNDSPGEVLEKVDDYLRSGVKLVWLVDYDKRKVHVYRPDKTFSALTDTDTLTGVDALDGLSILVADLFRFPGDAPAAPE